MAGIEEVGAQLSEAMVHADKGLGIVEETSGQRRDIHTALGELVTAAEGILNGAALVETMSGQVREGLGQGMLEYTQAADLVAQATNGSSSRDARWAETRYRQAGGDGSALENLSIKYLLLNDDRMPAILEAAEELKRLLSIAFDTSRRAEPHARDVAVLTEQGHDHVRMFAQESGIPLSE